MKHRGFTLVEVLIAMGVLAIAVTGTMGLMGMAIRKGSEGRQLTVAQQLAAELVESLRAEMRYDAASQAPGSAAFDTAWKYDVLPHAIQPAGTAGAACVGEICCQPPGLDDGVTYHYGPWPFAREGNTYYACYTLVEAAAQDSKGNDRVGIPAGSAEATVRILWRSEAGWRSQSMGQLLANGG